jgi:FAD/FMN-containing dehydrogenase
MEIKRVLDVWESGEEATHLAGSLKSQYDPTSVLNPGRFVHGI